jgi:DNA-binding MarR family transcriptional regulator
MVKKYANNDGCVIESYKLAHLLRQTSDAIHKAREIELRKYGITPEQAGALVCIRSLGNKATPAEISRWLFREPNSITILLRRMHKLGLITRKADTKRKNLIRIGLTKKGYEAYKHAIEFQGFFPVVDVLPERKRRQLWSLLQTMREKLFETLRLDVKAYSGFFDKEVIIDSIDSKGEDK